MSEEIIDDETLRRREMQLRGESWNDQHETILRQWGEASGSYRYMHHRAFLMYKKLSMRFTLPVIVLSTLTGTANFAQEQFPESVRSMVPSVIGGLNLIAGLVATIMQFLKINELMENHKAAALSYGLLSRNVRLTLALAREERSSDGLDFVNNTKTEYDRLIEQSPAIPTNILLHFEKEYPLDIVFTKPEIVDVRAIPKLRIDKPKTISTVKAITRGGPLEGVVKLLEPRTPPPSVTSDLEEGEILDEQDTR